MRLTLLMWRWRIAKARDVLARAVAWALPRRVAMWCAIRVAAHATQGRWSGQIVPELTAMEALRRWGEPHG